MADTDPQNLVRDRFNAQGRARTTKAARAEEQRRQARIATLPPDAQQAIRQEAARHDAGLQQLSQEQRRRYGPELAARTHEIAGSKQWLVLKPRWARTHVPEKDAHRQARALVVTQFRHERAQRQDARNASINQMIDRATRQPNRDAAAEQAPPARESRRIAPAAIKAAQQFREAARGHDGPGRDD
jgi:hypothetical protein